MGIRPGEVWIMAKIDELFNILIDRNGSDLHLTAGQPPKVRLHGRIEALDLPPLTIVDMMEYMMEVCEPVRWRKFLDSGDLDFAYSLADRARFRANYFQHIHGLGAVFRVIPTEIIPLADLGMPPAVERFVELRNGLILMTGPTGSGKSTTLAAIIDMINSQQCKHILTIEEPIEFVHPVKKSVIVQREVGIDVKSFADGLRIAPRQDIDVILVGEMRDLETISLAVSAAERGLLVFGTLHTNSAAKTIDRIIDVFPTEQRDAIRAMLAQSLKGVCTQTLCKNADGRGRSAAVELLVSTPALSNIIREGKTSKINNIIQTGADLGMQLMDDSIARLQESGLIDGKEAYLKAFNKERFQQ